MALKLERTFGADANMLIRRQAELEEQAEKAATEVRAARQEAAGYLKITSTEIANWAGTIEARTHLPVLVRSEEHTSELQSLMRISYAVFCLTKTKTTLNRPDNK